LEEVADHIVETGKIAVVVEAPQDAGVDLFISMAQMVPISPIASRKIVRSSIRKPRSRLSRPLT
jgi:hypothetical protein